MIEDDIGKWYADKRKEADNLRVKISNAEENVLECTSTGSNCFHCAKLKKEIKQLKKQLERALYVGD